jgi:LuxR family transcriptional regulator, maltose regulon positive regulatory protein
VTTDTETSTRDGTVLGDPIMTAKFLVPAPNGPMLRRRRLVDRLSTAVAGHLVTLVCAPAGSGKTVLASSWVVAGAVPGTVVWISLDEEDDRPGVFWTYLITGLEHGGVDVEGVGLPRSVESVDRSLLVRLAARLSERAETVVIVLDNADGLSQRRLADDLDFLLRHAGERLRLVVLARVEPALPLPLYRLERLVAEVRFPDLAFTLGEARELLRARRRNLSENAVHTVSDRTRGWAAGLRLVELPDGHGHADERDPAASDDSDLAGYFRSEVLGKQPPNVRDVLLATSVADVVPTALARHLSDSKDAGMILRTLAQQAAFVASAPDADEVYRYHPIVRELLVGQLRSEHPRRWRRLQRKAARWFESAGRTVEAVHEYASGGNWVQVARLLVRQDGLGRLLAGTSTAPLAVACARMPAGLPGPEPAVVAAAVALVDGDLEACDKHLARAEELAADEPEDRRADLDAAVALTALTRFAAAGAPGGGPVADAADAAVDRLRALRPVDAVVGALLAHGRGCTLLADGRPAPARQTLAAAERAAHNAGCPELASRCVARLALAEALLGRLREACDTAARARRTAEASGGAAQTLAAADVALAWVASERGDLPEATTHARHAAGDPLLLVGVTTAPVLALVRARLLRARGDLPGALAALDRLRDVGPLPDALADRVGGAAAGLLLAQGRPAAAADRVRDDGADDGSSGLLALGWAALALGEAADGEARARRVTRRSGAPLDLQVEGHLLAAACALTLSRPESAAAAVDEALRLASPERIRRPFDEAPRRIRALLQQRDAHAAHRLSGGRPDAGGGGAVPLARAPEVLTVQPLTDRELDVLGYLDALLPTQEIAARMYVSVNTVKSHVRAILRKLAVERRNEAVRRARELGLI